jgi:spore maturation protein CgeB
MRILLVAPGASWSVADVWRGFHSALKAAGHDVIDYALDGRIQIASGYLDHAWRRARATQPDLPRPTGADALYQASIGLIERALRHQPDWTLLISGTYIHPEALHLAQRAGIRMAALLTESPYADDQERLVASFCDVVFTNERASIPTFSDIAPTYYWRHSFDPGQHHPPTAADPDPECEAHDLVFVGTGFVERCEILSAIDWTGIDLGLYGAWELIGSRSRLRSCIRGGLIDNRLTAALYRRAKIGLSLHRTSIGFGKDVLRVTGAESMNPRDYELAACGTFYIADARAELTETLGALVPTFNSARELRDLVLYWSDNARDSERQARAAALPAAVAEFTFDTRAAELVRILQQHA